MCGRFTQHYTWSEVLQFLRVFGPPRNLQPHYNIAPTMSRTAPIRVAVLRYFMDATVKAEQHPKAH